MNIVVDRLGKVLASEPAVVALGAVSTIRPEHQSDMPAITVTLDVSETAGRGLGRIIRARHGIVKNVQTVVVQAGSQFESATFDQSLTQFKLWPLPVRRNPNAPQGSFGAHDIRVTNLASGDEYAFSKPPSSSNEFYLDPEVGVLTFGGLQVAGHQLEIEHWTLAWREDIRSELYQRELALSAWGSSYATVDDIFRRLIARLRSPYRAGTSTVRKLAASGLPASSAAVSGDQSSSQSIHRHTLEGCTSVPVLAGAFSFSCDRGGRST